MSVHREYIGLLIGAARRRVKQALVARLQPHRLDPRQFWLLLAVQDLPDCSAGALAERQRSDISTVSRLLATFARRGLVRLERDHADRRRAVVTLTPAGRKLATRLRPLADEIRATIVKDLTTAEEDALRAGLRKVVANLEGLLGALPEKVALTKSPPAKSIRAQPPAQKRERR